MKCVKFSLSLLIFIVFLFSATILYSPLQADEGVMNQKKVLLAIIPQDKPFLMPKYLDQIEQLDYDKKLITIYINTYQSSDAVKKILSSWLEKHSNDYNQIFVESQDENLKSPIQIRSQSLNKAKEIGSDYYFSIEDDCLVTPHTLKTLIKTNKPIVAPLLHTIPGSNVAYSNYFCAVTPSGYYESHPNYLPILERKIKGTFKVPLVHKVILIQSNVIDQLLCVDCTESSEYDFIVLGREARSRNIDQYICNDGEFGVIVKLDGGNEAEQFAVIDPYINIHQQHNKKIIYIAPNWWGDIFNPNSARYNMKSWLTLRPAVQAAGYDLVQTRTFDQLENFEKLIVFEVYDDQLKQYSRYPKEKLILFVWEPPNVDAGGYNSDNHQYFSMIYTWRDDLVNHEKYRKLFYPDQRPMRHNPVDFDAKKLAIIVAGNRYWGHPYQLSSERLHTIDFYEKHHPNEFDLFGINWPAHYKVYKGKMGDSTDSTDHKINALMSYKFSFAYENIKEVPGYITEKIFNCFEAACVPIYWGASNVTKYIPKNCFIDRRDFASDEELYHFLKNMTKEEHEEYIHNTKEYLASEQVKPYTIDHFVKNFMAMIIPQSQPVVEQPTIAKTTYRFPKEPIDVIILSNNHEKEKLEQCIQGVKNHCGEVQRMIVVSPQAITDQAEWYDQKKFPFNLDRVKVETLSFNKSLNHDFDSYYRQLLKLYAPLTIPNISSNVLVLDDDQIFTTPTELIGTNGAGLIYTEKTSDELNVVQCQRLIPGFKRVFPDRAAATGFILIQKPVLEDFFRIIRENHYIEPWKAFCRTVDASGDEKKASLEEIYFSFVLARTEQAEDRLRTLSR